MTQKKDAEIEFNRARRRRTYYPADKRQGLYTRDEAGYLTEIAPDLSPREQDVRLAEISQQLDGEGYIDGAVAILNRVGYDAWRNCVDHVSVAPKTHITP